jgi:hypothetical protein
MKHAIIFTSAFSILASTSSLQAAPSGVTVPFVGCASDGQVGPRSAPHGNLKAVNLSSVIAEQLVFYQQGEDGGVLGPRGWHCVGVYGSNGSIFFLAPRSLEPGLLLKPHAQPLIGPAIQVTYRDAGTSGRFDVAEWVMRFFPHYRADVKHVIDEDPKAAVNYPSGPHPRDKLIFKTKRSIAYLTPARSQGLGTHSRLDSGNLPIRSAVTLDVDPNGLEGATMIVARLPPDMADLAPIILRQTERQYAVTE